MRFEIELPDDFFEEGEEERFKDFCSQIGEDNFENAIVKIIFSSLFEYKDMFLGKGMPTRGDEIRQYRLNYLIKYFYESRIPSEQEVGLMFHIPKSGELISKVLDKFSYENEERLKSTIKDVLNDRTENNNKNGFKIKIDSKFILKKLNKFIAGIDQSLTPIKKVTDTSGIYIIRTETFEALKEKGFCD